MAAIAIPLVTALAPEIINLIASLVHQFAPQAEQKFATGTGPVKFADVFGAVIGALTSAAAAGQIPKELPSDDAVKIVIQAVVTSLKMSGSLAGAPAQPGNPPQPQTITLAPGQSVSITAGAN